MSKNYIQLVEVISSNARAKYRNKIYNESLKIKLSESITVCAFHKSGNFSTNNITGEFSVVFKSETYDIGRATEVTGQSVETGDSEWVYDIYGSLVHFGENDCCAGVSNDHICILLKDGDDLGSFSEGDDVHVRIHRLEVETEQDLDTVC